MSEAMDGARRHVHRVWLRTRFVVKEVSGDILMTGLVKPLIGRIPKDIGGGGVSS